MSKIEKLEKRLMDEIRGSSRMFVDDCYHWAKISDVIRALLDHLNLEVQPRDEDIVNLIDKKTGA